MKYKITLSLTIVWTVGAMLIVIGQTRPAQIQTNEQATNKKYEFSSAEV